MPSQLRSVGSSRDDDGVGINADEESSTDPVTIDVLTSDNNNNNDDNDDNAQTRDDAGTINDIIEFDESTIELNNTVLTIITGRNNGDVDDDNNRTDDSDNDNDNDKIDGDDGDVDDHNSVAKSDGDGATLRDKKKNHSSGKKDYALLPNEKFNADGNNGGKDDVRSDPKEGGGNSIAENGNQVRGNDESTKILMNNLNDAQHDITVRRAINTSIMEIPGAYSVQGINNTGNDDDDDAGVGRSDVNNDDTDNDDGSSSTSHRLPTPPSLDNNDDESPSTSHQKLLPTPPSLPPSSEEAYSQLNPQQLITATVVVDEEDLTEQNRMRLIAETEERVRRELLSSMEGGGILVEAPTEEVVFTAPCNQNDTTEITGITQAEVITDAPSTSNRNMILIAIAIIALAVIVSTVVSITTPRTDEIINNDESNNTPKVDDDFANTTTNNNTEGQQQVVVQELSPRSACVTEKLDEWVALNTTLKRSLDSIMSTESYMVAKENCIDEIDAYNEIAGTSCELEKEFNSPWTYGDRWLAMTTVYSALNDGNENGIFLSDGEYLFAWNSFMNMQKWMETFNFIDPSGIAESQELFQQSDFLSSFIPNECLADCYIGIGDGCNHLYNQTIFDLRVDNVSIELNTTAAYVPQSFISPELYCDVQWGLIDFANHDLKLCSVRMTDSEDYDGYMMNWRGIYHETLQQHNWQCGTEFYCDNNDTTQNFF